MFKKLIKYKTQVVLLVAILGGLFLILGCNNQAAALEDSNSDYRVNAAPGDSMTTITRRALLSYDQVHDDVTLSPPQTIYCETNIVKQLGPRLLAVGEMFTVPFGLVERFANSSQNLSVSQLAAWGQYAQNVDFTATRPLPPNDESGSQTTNDQTTNTSLMPAATTGTNRVNTRSTLLPWYWWLGGLAGLVSIYYLIEPPSQKSMGSKAKKVSTRQKR